MRAFSSLFAVLPVTALLTGCIVPELDNYPADKSLGAGTIVAGQDAGTTSTTGGGGGGGGGGVVNTGACTNGTYGNNITFGNGATGYNGECTVGGSVNVLPSATADDIARLRQIRVINGSLTLNTPPGQLDLPVLQAVGGQLTVGAQNLGTSIVFTQLSSVGLIYVQQAQNLVSFSAPTLYSTVSIVKIESNPSLQSLFLGVTQVPQSLSITDNPQLQTVDVALMASVGQLTISRNALLASLSTLQMTLQVGTSWAICSNPMLDQTWISQFTANHPTLQALCN